MSIFKVIAGIIGGCVVGSAAGLICCEITIDNLRRSIREKGRNPG